MKKTTVIAIPSAYYVVITTLVHALLATISLELDNASGEEEKDIVVDDSSATANTSDNKTSVQELGDPHCKSPCPPNTEMCIQMCA
ncbi:MAG TPA: hypothetical protein VFP49_00720 [Nitrososphaeraceae archaeon]|nr:hypothetical protein [Nitrososphaeraceae archaeon]